MSYIATSHTGVTARSTPRKPLPRGVGLLAGALASLALWGGLFWLAAAVV